MRRSILLTLFVVCEACGADPPDGTPADPSSTPPPTDAAPTASAPTANPQPTDPGACTPKTGVVAPTYTELYEKYFAKGQPGHCATAHCHADPEHDVWLCGDDKSSCYAGMVKVGLINPKEPLKSLLGDPTESPLSWINPTGNMPFDATGPFPEGRDAILAWVAACAPND